MVAVLALATAGGQAVGAVASVLAMLCFNFFFLPPLGTLAVEDPANWVALVSFLGASTFASRLVAAARARAEEARQRQRDVEVLFAKASHLEAVRESEALKTALLRAVSHDLRTPLTAMRLEIESLEARLAGHPEVLASVRGLAVEQARLARRIDNLLALARLEAGVARPRPEPTPPGSLFRAARESLALILTGREVATHIAPGCPDLLADPSLTVEILVNLLENAARASPAGTALELAAALDPDRPGYIRLEVLDRGPGMADVAGDRAAGGLGLRIATSFAEAQGGSLELLARPGGGTIARILLPAEPDLPEAAA
jgi:two-component system sensor histidine kinase KdpD